ncbi:MAG: hypothetical protein RJB38_406 [Pseudomonadota bacterium]|jgi:hypothetical protein
MRESPWSERRPLWLEIDFFLRILERHRLSRAWLQHLSPQLLGAFQTSSRGFLALASLPEFSFDELPDRAGGEVVFSRWCEISVGRVSVQEALAELAVEVRKHELWVASHPAIHSARLRSSEIARDQGAHAALRFFGGGEKHSRRLFAKSEDADRRGYDAPSLSSVVLYWHHSAWGCVDAPAVRRPLFERETPHEVIWIPEVCPHRDLLLREDRQVADFLCERQRDWFHGFAAAWHLDCEFRRLGPKTATEACRVALVSGALA